MTLTSVPPVLQSVHSDPAPESQTSRAHRGPASTRIEAWAVFGVSFVAYFIVAMLLDFKYHSFVGDAVARMANGFYMLHSRDPHLAAVGFVWNPLSSVSDLPLLLFNSWFPMLASHNVAGTTVSSLAMAGAAYQIWALLQEWGLQAAPRLLLTALFAFDPMVLYFGGNGMSEALYLFCMLAAARYLSRWLKGNDLPSLVYAAIALGFGYLERSEPIAAAGLAVPLIFLVTFSRSSENRRLRIWAGLTDVTIFLLPILTAFVGWALVSYVITGAPFQQFTSKYGNATLLANSDQKPTTLHIRLVHEAKAIAYMAPLLVLIVVLALAVAVVRRNIGVAAVVAILSGGLGFTLASYAANAIFDWYRYYILVAPIAVLLVGSLFAVPVRLRMLREQSEPSVVPVTKQSPLALKVAGSVAACVVSVALLGASFPATVMAMTNFNMAPDVVQYTGWFLFPNQHLNVLTIQAKYSYGQVESMSKYLENRHFANGDVVVDNANSCIPNVDTNVTNPRIFVIHNDRDFDRALADPLTFHAHYLLVGLASDSDAILGLYPNIARASWVKLVHTFNYPSGGFCNGFKLYKVIGHPTQNY